MYKRIVMWECEKEYETLEEAKQDEEQFIKDCFPNSFENPELYENKLVDDLGTEIEEG